MGMTPARALGLVLVFGVVAEARDADRCPDRDG